MHPPPTPPPAIPTPWMARLTSPAGPATLRLFSREDATVVAVPGRYSVSYLVLGEDAVIVVDIGSLNDHRRILSVLRWLDRPTSQIRCVLPTHLHMDHIIGMDAFAQAHDLPIALGPVALAAVQGHHQLRFPSRLNTLRVLPTWFMQGAPTGALRDWRRGLGFGFPWSRNRFQAQVRPISALDPLPPGWTVLHTPGHADDAICLFHARSGFLIAGDTVRNFQGGEWNPLLCDRAAYDRTQAQLRSLPVRTIFPGHGPIIEGRGIEGEGVIHTLKTRAWFQV